LAEKIKKYRPESVITSREPKAIQTGDIVAGILKISTTVASGLHEHEREGQGLTSRESFEAGLKHFFDEPSRLVFGLESADQALARFSAAVTAILGCRPRGSIVIVAHGTVIALWATSLIGGDPFAFWKRMGMPSFMVFSRPGLELVEVVEDVP
jgi:broad specificity phosphatase PhoE